MEKIIRPWGDFYNIIENSEFKIKKICVSPNQAPSYQYHFKREEYWVVLSGEGELKLDGEIIKVSRGSFFKIKKEQKHQIKNTGQTDLVFIEVQLGEYFGEDDIVRLEDNYGRA